MRIKNRVYSALTIVFIGLLPACYYDSEEYLYPQLDSNCDTTNFTYVAAVQQILSNNCYSCHSNANAASGGNVKFENYADLKIIADNGKLIGSITHQSGFSPMPKNGGKLPNCNITIIQKWINAGALNN